MTYELEHYAFGVDIGGTSIKVGLFTTSGKLMDKWEIKTRTDACGKHILPDVAQTIEKKLVERCIEKSSVQGIGVGVPGAVRGEDYVEPCVNLNQWGGFDAAKALSELIGIPVKLANDANIAALGEMWRGGAEGHDNIVFVTLGTGVGGGIVVGGKILSGVHGAGGEIGHIKVRHGETETCGCGKMGCLEQYASATGIVRTAHQLIMESNEHSVLREIDSLTSKDVFAGASRGDALSQKVINSFAQELGRALATVSCVCDPEVIVIGGGVSAAGQSMLDAVQKQFREYAFPSAEATQFHLATLGNDAGIYGGVRLVVSSPRTPRV